MIVKSIEVGMLQVNCYVLGCEATGEGVVIDPGEIQVFVRQGMQPLGSRFHRHPAFAHILQESDQLFLVHKHPDYPICSPYQISPARLSC